MDIALAALGALVAAAVILACRAQPEPVNPPANRTRSAIVLGTAGPWVDLADTVDGVLVRAGRGPALGPIHPGDVVEVVEVAPGHPVARAVTDPVERPL